MALLLTIFGSEVSFFIGFQSLRPLCRSVEHLWARKTPTTYLVCFDSLRVTSLWEPKAPFSLSKRSQRCSFRLRFWVRSFRLLRPTRSRAPSRHRCPTEPPGSPCSVRINNESVGASMDLRTTLRSAAAGTARPRGARTDPSGGKAKWCKALHFKVQDRSLLHGLTLQNPILQEQSFLSPTDASEWPM